MVQQKITEIWQKTLKLDAISPDDDFFDLGGHSLLMAQIQESISNDLGIEVPMDELFRHPTVKEISHYIESRSVTR
ncbi:acyl carrier protein [Streptomyces cyaneofuscatus]|uniref:acyl carrier protein n=1 Tax=Streptomyces cyaneofuscatus TaxID=66883 RepID=UPI003821E89E